MSAQEGEWEGERGGREMKEKATAVSSHLRLSLRQALKTLCPPPALAHRRISEGKRERERGKEREGKGET